ncbi:MAG: coenzyme F420-0:L-glutamate ligase [Candidatus Heimdallarchaeota archaeon]|nr:coenzyme F420-0:L-glutamate ligase [Candidatus Heimdallarchaeota archaeon]
MLQIIPIMDIPLIETEDQLWSSLLDSLQGTVQDGDILVCAHTPFSRVMGYKYNLADIKASKQAIEIAEQINKDPRKIEVVLKNSTKVVKVGRGVIITENKSGVVCANAGIDQSNASLDHIIAVPEDPDALASQIRDRISSKLYMDVAVIISDTVGRALRKGAVNIAIGCAGIDAMRSEIGKKDLFGYEMRVSTVAIADELAAAAELLQGQTDEAIPFVIIRGYKFQYTGDSSAKSLNRPEDERLFR